MQETIEQFRTIVNQFTKMVESNDGEGLAALFTDSGCYQDGFYGDFSGRKEISRMLSEHFWGHAEAFSWKMQDLVTDGKVGYARYLFSYSSKLPNVAGKRVVFEGTAQFVLREGLIENYSEVFNTGLALAQLEFSAGHIQGHLKKKALELRREARLE